MYAKIYPPQNGTFAPNYLILSNNSYITKILEDLIMDFNLVPIDNVDLLSDKDRKSAYEIIKTIGRKSVRLNYDFGNAFTYSKGKIDPAADYKEALPYACHLHLKDLKQVDDGWEFPHIGGGVIDYDTIFEELGAEEKLLPLSIEQLYSYKVSKDLIVYRMQRPPSLSQISTNLKRSIAYVQAAFKPYS